MNKKIRSTGIFLFSTFMFLTVFIDRSFAGFGDYNHGYSGYHMMNWTGMGWMMILFWLLVLMVLILLIRWIMSITQKESRESTASLTAVDILKERFARGEIDDKEFESKKRILSES